MHPAAADLAKYLKVTGTDIDLTRDQDGGDCDFVATRDGKWIADVAPGVSDSPCMTRPAGPASRSRSTGAVSPTSMSPWSARKFVDFTG